MIEKNRNRKKYSFANINLLGRCNIDCYFCLGKDIEENLNGNDQLNTHFSEWKNFDIFLKICHEKNIIKIYLTGLNTDPLLYKYFSELRDYIQNLGFEFGIRTNGYLVEKNIDEIKKCNGEIGLSIHSLESNANYKIIKRNDIPKWENIIPNLENVRVSIVINRHNVNEVFKIIKYLSQFRNIKYVQLRKISTDTRIDALSKDIEIYEDFFKSIESSYDQINKFHLAQQFNMWGMKINFWRTIETDINSLNYFTNGIVSGEYFVIEGYLKNNS